MRLPLAIAATLLLTHCSVIDPLVYKIDIPQGNYIEQRDVDNLRVGMTREQVRYVLGAPVAENAFNHDEWHYVFRLKPGRGDVQLRQMTLNFESGQLVSITGDYEPHADFNVPIEQ